MSINKTKKNNDAEKKDCSTNILLSIYFCEAKKNLKQIRFLESNGFSNEPKKKNEEKNSLLANIFPSIQNQNQHETFEIKKNERSKHTQQFIYK